MKMEIVHEIKKWIYIVGLGALFVACLTKCAHAKPKWPKYPTYSEEAFWPPDLIPHPNLPEPEKTDDRMS
jgi:hypothetical protein